MLCIVPTLAFMLAGLLGLASGMPLDDVPYGNVTLAADLDTRDLIVGRYRTPTTPPRCVNEGLFCMTLQTANNALRSLSANGPIAWAVSHDNREWRTYAFPTTVAASADLNCKVDAGKNGKRDSLVRVVWGFAINGGTSYASISDNQARVSSSDGKFLDTRGAIETNTPRVDFTVWCDSYQSS